jgi:osmoprotectant transport system ATP-binding protein
MDGHSDREPIIEFRNVTYAVQNGAGRPENLLNSLSFTVFRGETLVLLGRSGAGKTTALKLINRLLEPSAGEVLVEGKSTLSWNAIALRRRIGYVIQETGLFPHYTVAENVALVPRLERWRPERIEKRVNELLDLVGLAAQQFRRRYPHELSGGQRQRVGLARALAADPAILLMDEPFGALDPLTRAEVRREFQALKQRLGKTIVIVTHDIHEAITLATRIALIDSGKLSASFSPEEFLRSSEPAVAAYAAQLRELETLRARQGDPVIPPALSSGEGNPAAVRGQGGEGSAVTRQPAPEKQHGPR